MNPRIEFFNVGCPSLDHINFKNDNQIKECLEILNLKYKTNINTKKEYLVFLYHPDTNKYFQEFNVVLEPLILASKKLKANLVIIQPNSDAGSTEIVESLNILKNQNFKEGKFNELNIDYLNHLTSSEYITLLQGCKVLVGNSSSGIREGSFLGISVVNIGER